MKTEVTKRFVCDSFGVENIFNLGYCDAYGILRALGEPQYYTCGVYGWNADIYVIDGKCICTGYRPFGKKKVDCKKLQAAENHIHELPYKKAKAYARRVFKRLFV